MYAQFFCFYLYSYDMLNPASISQKLGGYGSQSGKATQ